MCLSNRVIVEHAIGMHGVEWNGGGSKGNWAEDKKGRNIRCKKLK